MPLSYGAGDGDKWWPWLLLALVVEAFRRVVFGEVSFDYPGVGAMSTVGVQDF